MWRDPLQPITIGSRRAGPGEPFYTIAEIGLNHGGSLPRALAMVDAAAAAGASAVKVQALVASALVAPSCPPPAHVAATSLREFFSAFELPDGSYAAIADRARARGLGMIATPLSLDAVAMLERAGVDAYKIASGDLTWDQLIARCARTGRPVIISTGMATMAEAAHAVDVARRAGGRQLALLHCVSAYPVPAASQNLQAIATLGRAFSLPVGLSDHAADESAVPIAVTLGASLYERHLMLDGDGDAVDGAVSSTPARFVALVEAAARTLRALGSGDKVCLPAEAVNVIASRRAVCATRPLPAGHVIEAGDLVALRPATGLAPAMAAGLAGRRLARPVTEGAALLATDLEEVEAAQGCDVA